MNELFNLVNHITEVVLEPLQERDIILGFLPISRKSKSMGSEEGMVEDLEAGDDRSDFVEVQGLISVHIFLLDPVPPHKPAAGENGTPQADGETVSRRTSNESLSSQLPFREDPPGEAAKGDQQVNIKFKARVCRSVLRVEGQGRVISFDSCVLGEDYVKDFVIRNRSEIELFWSVNTTTYDGKHGSLEFRDQDTEALLEPRPIPGYSLRKVRVVFRPKEIGLFNHVVAVENINDPNNTELIRIEAAIRAVQRDEGLRVREAQLNYGDCYSGIAYAQQIRVKNVSDRRLDVHFASDVPDQVFFELKTEPLVGDLVDDAVTTLVVPTSSANPPSASSSSASSSATNSSSTSATASATTSAAPIGATSASVKRQVAMSRANSPIPTLEADPEKGDSLLAPSVVHKQPMRIEELSLSPGVEKVVDIWYRPVKAAIEERMGRLTRRSFNVILSYSDPEGNQERKTLPGLARVCTSLISLTPQELNFGDTDVGRQKVMEFVVQNKSDLQAKFQLGYTSKILSIGSEEGIIPPKQSTSVKVKIFPRKVNPDYRKQVTIQNLLNRENDQILEVVANNVDQHQVTFHSLLYQITTPSSQNFIDFGFLIVNNPTIRTFAIHNISDEPLVISVASNLPEEIAIYTYGRNPQRTQGGATPDMRERLLESLDTRKTSRRSQRLGSSSFSTDDLGISGSLILPLKKAAKPLGRKDSANQEDLLSPSESQEGSPASPPTPVTASQAPDATTDLSEFRSRLESRPQSPFPRSLTSVGGDMGDGGAQPASSSSSSSVYPSSTTTSPPAAPTTLTSTFSASMEQLDLPTRFDMKGLVEALNNPSPIPMSFRETDGEKKLVHFRQTLRRELELAIAEGLLQPVSEFAISPKEEGHEDPDRGKVHVVVLFKASSVNVVKKLKKYDAKLLFRLVDFDRNIQEGRQDTQFRNLLELDAAHIPVREFMIQAKVCESKMELGHRNINFGQLQTSERREKAIVIKNLSEVPLLYTIRKTGSIASGDLTIFDGRMGVVRPFGRREVHFVFEPSFPGHFQEALSVENIQDPNDRHAVVVKATIRKPLTFTLAPTELFINDWCVDEDADDIKIITVTNTGKIPRTYVVEVDPATAKYPSFDVRWSFALNTGGAGLMTKEVQERIEELRQKLKIAIRKGNTGKAQTLQEELDKLDPTGATAEPSAPPSTPAAATPEDTPQAGSVDADTILPPPVSAVMAPEVRRPKEWKEASRVFSLTLDPQKSANIAVTFWTLRTSMTERFSTRCDPVIVVHEQRNADVVKVVTCHATVLSSLAMNYGKRDSPTLAESSLHSQDSQDSQNSLEGSSEVVPLPVERLQDLAFEEARRNMGEVEVGKVIEGLFQVKNWSTKEATFSLQEQPLFDGAEGGVATPATATPPTLAPPTTVSEQNRKYSASQLSFGIFRFDEPQTTVGAGETAQVKFTAKTKNPGRQLHYITLRNLRHPEQPDSQLAVVLDSIQPKYLRLPTIVDEHGEMDFGNCYVDPTKRFAKVLPFELRNRSDTPLYLTCSSNLAHQVFVFEDLDLTIPAVDTILPPLDKRTVFICLQPKIQQELHDKGFGRQLIGGIQLNLYNMPEPTNQAASAEPSPRSRLVKETIKFKSVIGNSVLSVSEEVIRLGATSTLGEVFKRDFVISNKSSPLPADFKIECSDRIKLSSSEGRLLQDSRIITLRYTATCYGYCQEVITIRNVNSPSQVVTLFVYLYVEDGTLRAKIEGTPAAAPASESSPQPAQLSLSQGQEAQQEGASIQLLDFLSYTQRNREAQQGDPLWVLARPEYRFIVLENNLAESVHLTAKSDLDLEINVVSGATERKALSADLVAEKLNDLRPEKEEPKAPRQAAIFDLGTTRPVRPCGSFKLRPNRFLRIRIRCPQPGESQGKLLSQDSTKPATLSGVLAFEGTTSRRVIKMFDLRAVFHVSLGGAVLDSPLNLGRVGHANGWRNLAFTFDIKNQAQIPLRCYAPTPPPHLLLHPFHLDDPRPPTEGEPQALSELLEPYFSGSSDGSVFSHSSSPASSFSGDLVEQSSGSTFHSNSHSPRSSTPLPASAADADSFKDSKDSGVLFPSEGDETFPVATPEGFRLVVVPPLGTLKVRGLFSPGRLASLEAGERKDLIRIFNFFNPANAIAVPLSFAVSPLPVRLNRLSGNNELVLSPLTCPPVEGAAPASTWFSLECTSDMDTMKVDLAVDLLPEYAELVSVEVLSMSSNTLIGSTSLDKGDARDVRVRATAREPSVSAPRSIQAELFGSEPFVVGNLKISADGTTTVVPIRLTLVSTPYLTLSKTRLQFVNSLPRSVGEVQESQSAAADSFKRAISPPRLTSLSGSGVSSPPPELAPSPAASPPLPLSASSPPPPTDFEPQRQELAVRNGSLFSLHFRVELPARMSRDVLQVTPPLGVVPPGEDVKVMVEMLRPLDPMDTLDDVLVHFEDTRVRAPKVSRQAMLINFLFEDATAAPAPDKMKKSPSATPLDERLADPSVDHGIAVAPGGPGGTGAVQDQQEEEDLRSSSALDTSLVAAASQTRLQLKGCTKVADMVDSSPEAYEIHFGQSASGSPPVTWEFSISNTSLEAVSYRLSLIRETDRSWLALGRTEGTLGPAHRKESSQAITLTAKSERRELLTTYVLVENESNPLDLKTIRVTLEVVGPSSGRQHTSIFDVLLPASESKNPPSLFLGHVLYDSPALSRSFILSNNLGASLDFTFGTNVTKGDYCEIQFSLTPLWPNFLKHLTVPGNTRTQVFVFFTATSPSPQGERESTTKNLEIYINPRLVKDYQYVLKLQARCFERRLVFLSPQRGVVFKAADEHWGADPGEDRPRDQQGPALRLEPTTPSDVQLGALGSQPLSFAVVNGTRYFHVDTIFPSEGSHAILRVTPNLAAIEGNLHALRRERYAEEHLAVYNAQNIREVYWVPLRLSFGILSNFTVVSGGRLSHNFRSLESRLVSFLGRARERGLLVTLPLEQPAEDLMEVSPDGSLRQVSLDRDLVFQYQYLVDELVLSGLEDLGGDAHAHLALLLFKTLLDTQTFRSADLVDLSPGLRASLPDPGSTMVSPALAPNPAAASVMSPPMAPLQGSSQTPLMPLPVVSPLVLPQASAPGVAAAFPATMLPSSPLTIHAHMHPHFPAINTSLTPASSLPSPVVVGSPAMKEEPQQQPQPQPQQPAGHLWPPQLYRWIQPFEYYLSFFSTTTPQLTLLVQLLSELREAQKARKKKQAS